MNATEMAETTQLDESAVAAVRAGDAERYRELVERHERRVFAVAWSRLGDAALAEEATQEAFIRAYRRLWLLGDGAKFSGWVSTIARRVAINFGLRHRRELNKRERWALENFSETGPEKSAEENEPLHSPETLRQTLAELPDSHRECLVLFYLEGKSGAEAATALGISEAALRVRLHRARAALRERLEEKLESSLEKLRPAKTLVPAVMAGVLASSSAKAATAGGAGAALTGALAKLGLTKWLLPLGSLFSFVFVLPMLSVSWLIARLELKNFRDQKGFRARLFRVHLKDRVLLILFAVIAGLVLIPLIAGFVNRSLFSGTKPEVIYLLIAAFCAISVPFAVRQTLINRNRFFLVSVGGQILIGSACLLAGVNILSPNAVMVFFFGQALFALPFYGQRPVRMDYNLFLRAAENLLPELEPESSKRPRRSKSELLAFARFLGTRWLANHFRWRNDRLTLRLPPVGFSQFSGWTDLTLNWSFRNRSQIHLSLDGKVTAELGERDLRSLMQFRSQSAVPEVEWESLVAHAVAAAWQKFEAKNFAAAEQALGQLTENEVFVVSPAKGGIARVRWLMAALLVLCSLSFFGVHMSGCRALFARLDGLQPLNLTEAQAREFMSLVSTNPNPLVKAEGRGFTRKSFPQAPDMALFTCMVLPETNLFTPHNFQLMRESVFEGENPQAQESQRKFWLCDTPLAKRALNAGWIGWSDLSLTREDVAKEIRFGKFHEIEFKNEFLLARESAWSWVQSQRWEVKRANEMTLTQLRWLRAVNCLDLVDREKLIQQIVDVQTLSATPPNNPPIHDWKDVRGLFFTPCFPALQDTYFSLAALEILGGLDRIDREQCVRGILRVHHGKGFFTSPDSGSYNEYHIDGSTQDTIAAYESLRILGALDRVRDLDKWQFRTNRRHLAKDEITWREIEAWVAQQRLEKILRARQANPSAPWRSLLEPR
jgi:RNA polymerase sigma factor (sigma-70 family)